MNIDVDLKVRPAVLTDQRQIGNLIHFSSNVHRHLDWQGPLEWIGSSPFYVLECNAEVIAALGCPPEPPSVAWIRLFVNSGRIPFQDSWKVLWDKAHAELVKKGHLIAAAIVLQDWLRTLLLASGFTSRQSIVMLERDGNSPIKEVLPSGVIIRSLMPYDLPAVAELDSAAFELLWQNTLPLLERAYPQAVWPTLAERGGQVIGYQLSTRNPNGIHLARLAVRPDMQGIGVGYALVADLIQKVDQHGFTRLTVNTQGDNISSLALYQRMGFKETGERFQVFQLNA